MRNTGKADSFAGREGVANLDRPMIMETDNIPRHCRLYEGAIACTKGHCIGNAHVFFNPDVPHLHAFFVSS